MNQKAILERIAELEREQEKHLANANAVQGAILDCRYWLEKIKEGAPQGAPTLSNKEN